MKKLLCATYEGLDARVVDVELSLTKGLPSFSIIGGANALADARDRIKSALLSNEYKFPPKRVTINLAPSDDFKKSGSQFDLSMGLLILVYEKKVDLEGWFVFGELGLNGKVKENKLLYPLMLSLANQELVHKAIVPKSALEKLSNIPNVQLFGVETLKEAYEVLSKQEEIMAFKAEKKIEYPSYELEGEQYYYVKEYKEDFLDVKGQERAKRAALISAAGFHNIIFEGSPGCGKSMIASRMRYILPPLSVPDMLDIAKLQVLDGKEPDFKPHRNFKNPHHSATSASIFGGGSHSAKIGEVGLANSSILFFDELPHFSKNVLEALREPMQDGKIRISRVNSKVEYPANFLFIGAMNPCPCGNLLKKSQECRCNELEIQRYKNRLSDPFLERVDLNVVMQEVEVDDRSGLSSKEMHKKVVEAHIRSKQRGQKSFNAKMGDDEIEQFCQLNAEAKETLNMATNRFTLSFRSIKSMQKVARTIADLDSCDEIQKEHILEALSFRRR